MARDAATPAVLNNAATSSPVNHGILAAMAIIAVFNQKGGVGKTTTALNLLAGIAQRGQRPVGVDLDPQGHLSHVFGTQPRAADDTVFGFFARQRPLQDIARVSRSGVVICPSHMELAKLDAVLGKGVNVVTRLRHALRAPDAVAGPVVIDCCPLLNVLSLNAIFACDLIVVPVSADYLAVQGAKEVERALNALEPVFKQRLPRRYVITRFDMRRRMSAEVVAEMARSFRPEEVCITRIRENVKLAESPAEGLDVFRHAPESRGARDYEALLDELVGAGFLR
jgi:chromosome partitioning protein